MKIAVCVSGQPRFIDVAFPYLKENILDKNNCDVFFHAWFDKGMIFDAANWNQPVLPSDDIPQKLLDLYKPKKYLIEPNKNERFKQECIDIQKNTDAEPYITKSMYYGIQQSFQLKSQYQKETNTNYDAVIRLRFDVAIMNPLVISSVDDNKLYFVDVINNPLVPCDWCFYGTEVVMKKCMNIYDLIYQYSKREVKICGEELLNYHINFNSITKNPVKIGALLVRDSHFNNKTWGRVY